MQLILHTCDWLSSFQVENCLTGGAALATDSIKVQYNNAPIVYVFQITMVVKNCSIKGF